VEAITYVETGGNFHARGASGEGGAMQFLPSTWRAFSMDVYGEYREMTPIRERYVAIKMIEKWIAQGLSNAQIALKWNAGGATKCSAGVNSKGVPYDSCSYQKKVLALL
jgi:hypothetical protein